MPRKTKKQTRRGNKEGSIYRRKDGKWCGQVLAGYNEHGKPIRKTFYGEKREEVAQKISEATFKAFNGKLLVNNPQTHITVEKLVTDFLWTFKKPTVTDVTFEWYLNAARTHIIPAFGSIPFRELTPYQIQKLLNRLFYDEQRALKTLKCVRDVLNQTYKHAIEVRLIEVNPVTSTRLPKQSGSKVGEKEDCKVIPVDARTAILKATENDLRMKTAITVLMFTGMRIGEFLALNWGNVDLKKREITIDRAITHICKYDEDKNLKGRETVIGDTKTQCSRRKMKVSQVVTDTLTEWRKILPTHVLGTPAHDILADDAVVFPNNMGKMRTYNGFRTTYRRFMSENSLGTYTLHSYRHTFSTMLLERGVNPRVVQKLLGHRDIETTLGIYSHVLPEVFDGVAGIVEEIHADMLGGCYKPQIVPEPIAL